MRVTWKRREARPTQRGDSPSDDDGKGRVTILLQDRDKLHDRFQSLSPDQNNRSNQLVLRQRWRLEDTYKLFPIPKVGWGRIGIL